MLDQLEVALERQRRVLTDGVERGHEDSEVHRAIRPVLDRSVKARGAVGRDPRAGGGRQLEPDRRTAGVTVLGPHGAVVALDDLLDDREAETGAGFGPSGRGSVEAIEDVRPGPPVAIPGPSSRTSTRHPVITISIGPPAVLDRVVDEVREGSFGHVRSNEHRSGVAVVDNEDRRDRCGGAPARRRRQPAREADTVRCLVVAPIGRELDELRDEVGQLVHLESDALDGPGPLLGIELAGAVEQLRVRPEAGQRGAQLVARVGDELLLLALGHRQRVDHRREAGRQAPDLPTPGLGHGRVEVLGAGDALGRVPEVLDRADQSACERPAEQRGGDDSREAQQEQPEAE